MCLFKLVWLEIDVTGLDGCYSLYQGHLFYQKDTRESWAYCLGRLFDACVCELGPTW